MGDKATGETTVREGAPTRQILTDIAPYSWEHPADKAALQALRKIPVFDTVLRKLFSFVGEKPIRLAFQANAVRVSENQFGDIYRLYRRVLKTLDAPEEYPLFVSQTPMVNAGAYGVEQPFIILNSGTVRLIDEEEKPQAWTLMTALDGIEGFEETVGKERPTGEEYSKNFQGPNWLDHRRFATA